VRPRATKESGWGSGASGSLRFENPTSVHGFGSVPIPRQSRRRVLTTPPSSISGAPPPASTSPTFSPSRVLQPLPPTCPLPPSGRRPPRSAPELTRSTASNRTLSPPEENLPTGLTSIKHPNQKIRIVTGTVIRSFYTLLTTQMLGWLLTCAAPCRLQWSKVMMMMMMVTWGPLLFCNLLFYFLIWLSQEFWCCQIFKCKLLYHQPPLPCCFSLLNLKFRCLLLFLRYNFGGNSKFWKKNYSFLK